MSQITIETPSSPIIEIVRPEGGIIEVKPQGEHVMELQQIGAQGPQGLPGPQGEPGTDGITPTWATIDW